MSNIYQVINNVYNWIVRRVPIRVLHFSICFCVALLSWQIATGLALGRESVSLYSADKIKDTFGDLVSDFLGILVARIIKILIYGYN